MIILDIVLPDNLQTTGLPLYYKKVEASRLPDILDHQGEPLDSKVIATLGKQILVPVYAFMGLEVQFLRPNRIELVSTMRMDYLASFNEVVENPDLQGKTVVTSDVLASFDDIEAVFPGLRDVAENMEPSGVVLTNDQRLLLKLVASDLQLAYDQRTLSLFG